MRTYQCFDFVAYVVEESAGDVVESFATAIQWFSKTFMHILLVCAVTIVAIATEKFYKYFAQPPRASYSDELVRE